jgi:hypothetical protein
MAARAMKTDAEFEEQKRRLIARSEQHRQAMAAEVQHLAQSLAWIPRSVQLAKAASPYLAVVAPLGWALLRRRQHRTHAGSALSANLASTRTPPLKELMSKAWRGLHFFQQVWPVVQGFRSRHGNGAAE